MRISDWSSDVCSSDLLWQRCGLTVWYNDPARDIALWQHSPNAEIFLAESAGSVAGSICCGHDGHRGWLYAVAVDPDRQHRGIGERKRGVEGKSGVVRVALGGRRIIKKKKKKKI